MPEPASTAKPAHRACNACRNARSGRGVRHLLARAAHAVAAFFIASATGLASASAQPDSGSDDAGRAGSSVPAPRDSTPPRPAREDRVLFLVPSEFDPEEREALGEALMAQFSLGKAELLVALDVNAGEALGPRIRAAEARAADVRAVAVFWIEPEANRWLVHAFDSTRDRLLVRPIAAAPGHTSAAIEAVAVMARDSTEAMLAGDLPRSSAAFDATGRAAPAGWEPHQRREPRRPVRLSLAYLGQEFAEEVTWRHGVNVSAAWISPSGLFIGLAYTLSEGASVDAPIHFEVSRPFSLLWSGGYRQRFGAASLDAALGVNVSLLERHTPNQRGVHGTGDSARVETALSPRFRIEWAVAAPLGLFAGGGIDVLFNRFSYVQRGATDVDVLRPLPARGVVEAGIAYYP